MLKVMGSNRFPKMCRKNVLKPSGKEAVKNISKDLMKALQTSVALGSALRSKNPQAIMRAGLQSSKYLTTGSAIKISEITNSK